MISRLGAVVWDFNSKLKRSPSQERLSAPEPAEQERRLQLANAELSAVLGTLGDAIDSAACADSTLPVGQLGLALATMLWEDGGTRRGEIASSNRACEPYVLLMRIYPSLCALSANPWGSVGGRTCAADAIVTFAFHERITVEATPFGVEHICWLLNELETSGAITSCRALCGDNQIRAPSRVEAEQLKHVHGQRSQPTLDMPVSRSHLRYAAYNLCLAGDELKGVAERIQSKLDADGDEEHQ